MSVIMICMKIRNRANDMKVLLNYFFGSEFGADLDRIQWLGSDSSVTVVAKAYDVNGGLLDTFTLTVTNTATYTGSLAGIDNDTYDDTQYLVIDSITGGTVSVLCIGIGSEATFTLQAQGHTIAAGDVLGLAPTSVISNIGSGGASSGGGAENVLAAALVRESGSDAVVRVEFFDENWEILAGNDAGAAFVELTISSTPKTIGYFNTGLTGTNISGIPNGTTYIVGTVLTSGGSIRIAMVGTSDGSAGNGNGIKTAAFASGSASWPTVVLPGSQFVLGVN